MNARPGRRNPSILPWQVPTLDGLDTITRDREPSDRAEGEAAVPAEGAPASGPLLATIFEEHTVGPGGLAPVALHDAAATEPPDQEAAARSHAQALAHGLEEGRTRGFAEGHVEGHAAGYAEGFAAGHAEGMEQGRQAGQAGLAGQARRLAALIERLDAPIPALERVVEDAVVALALEVARTVIGTEVAHSREYLVRLIREAVAKVPIGMGKPRLVLNFSDLELIQSLASDIAEQRVALVGDESVEPGGCLVVAHSEDVPDRRWHPRASEGVSQVDLTLPTRWRAVMHSLFEGEKE